MCIRDSRRGCGDADRHASERPGAAGPGAAARPSVRVPGGRGRNRAGPVRGPRGGPVGLTRSERGRDRPAPVPRLGPPELVEQPVKDERGEAPDHVLPGVVRNEEGRAGVAPPDPGQLRGAPAVSYTHLTLPTILRV